jgi:hypothetical protein
MPKALCSSFVLIQQDTTAKRYHCSLFAHLCKPLECVVEQCLADFFCKVPGSTYFKVCEHCYLSVATNQLCYCRAKTTIDDM